MPTPNTGEVGSRTPSSPMPSPACWRAHRGGDLHCFAPLKGATSWSAIEYHRAHEATGMAQRIGNVCQCLEGKRDRVGAVVGGIDGATFVRANPLPPPACLRSLHPACHTLRRNHHAEREPVAVDLPRLLPERTRVFNCLGEPLAIAARGRVG